MTADIHRYFVGVSCMHYLHSIDVRVPTQLISRYFTHVCSRSFEYTPLANLKIPHARRISSVIATDFIRHFLQQTVNRLSYHGLVLPPAHPKTGGPSTIVLLHNLDFQVFLISHSAFTSFCHERARMHALGWKSYSLCSNNIRQVPSQLRAHNIYYILIFNKHYRLYVQQNYMFIQSLASRKD